jgi:hypothetical protein
MFQHIFLIILNITKSTGNNMENLMAKKRLQYQAQFFFVIKKKYRISKPEKIDFDHLLGDPIAPSQILNIIRSHRKAAF